VGEWLPPIQCFFNAIFFFAAFSETRPCTCWLLTYTSVGETILKKMLLPHQSVNKNLTYLGWGCLQPPISHPLDKIEIKFQRLSNEINGNVVRLSWKWEIQYGDPENIDKCVRISFLSHLQAEVCVFPVYRPPYWISYFRFGRTTLPLISLDSLTPKNMEIVVIIPLPSCLQAEI